MIKGLKKNKKTLHDNFKPECQALILNMTPLSNGNILLSKGTNAFHADGCSFASQ